jgi:hypothetical protein
MMTTSDPPGSALIGDVRDLAVGARGDVVVVQRAVAVEGRIVDSEWMLERKLFTRSSIGTDLFAEYLGVELGGV